MNLLRRMYSSRGLNQGKFCVVMINQKQILLPEVTLVTPQI